MKASSDDFYYHFYARIVFVHVRVLAAKPPLPETSSRERSRGLCKLKLTSSNKTTSLTLTKRRHSAGLSKEILKNRSFSMNLLNQNCFPHNSFDAK